MADFIAQLFDSSDFPARWRCGTWTSFHGWLYIVSDLAIWSAYLAIPCVLGYFVIKRKSLPFRPVVMLFVLFIVACGTTHLLDALMFWWPAYRLSAVARFLTGIVSWATVVALVPMVPKVLSLRSPAELEQEIAERIAAESRLRQSEVELRAALEEKQVLVREVHHRVKNNLQVICSLLDMQMLQAKEEDSAEALREAQSRVHSMAMIHEHLYQDEPHSGIHFAEYLRGLLTHLASAYKRDDQSLELVTDIPSIDFPIDAAVPCGLIVNELVSNSLKHAFAGRRDGCIRVSLQADDALVKLMVADNGSGLAPGIDPAKPRTLGLRLVSALTDQLQGTLRIESRDGTTFCVTFPRPGLARKG